MKDRKRALKQLKELQKKAREIRLAADGWDAEWKTLIATLLSARTMDKVTIPVADKLFEVYGEVGDLSKAKVEDVEKIIRPVNFFRNKAKNVVACAKGIFEDFKGNVPHDLEKLVTLAGVGRKTGNVFLAEYGYEEIGVDTHVNYISHYLGWTQGKSQEEVEKDLKSLFPKNWWGKINWILVRFGQTHTNRRIKDEVLNEIKKIR